jgi:GNAT superfamily N-acetyltransferase
VQVGLFLFSMQIKKYHSLNDAQKRALFDLWNNEYPAQISHADMATFDSYLDDLENVEHFLVEDEHGKIKGWYFHFTREKATWFAIILSHDVQGKGIGSTLIQHAKEIEIELNGWVTDHDHYKKRNGEVYRSPLGFYQKNGFEVLEGEQLEVEVLSAVRITWKKE